ncbi:MAG: potassium channel family protein [Bacteroidota bacterium]
MIFFRTIITFIKDEEYRSLLITSTVIIGVGGIVYHYLEGWDWVDAFYFSVITLTTIGYGDFAPQTPAGKIFTMFYILIGLGMILTFINTVYRHYNNVSLKEKEKKKNNKKHKDKKGD